MEPAFSATASAARPHTRGPRQGVGIRICVSTRERTSRTLLLRVVRRALPARGGTTRVSTGNANGRSAYVARNLTAVRDARQRGRLARALRASVPASVFEELEAAAMACEQAATSLGAADAFGRDSPLTPVDELASPALAHDVDWL